MADRPVFTYRETAGVSTDTFTQLIDQLTPEIYALTTGGSDYKTPYGFARTPFDTERQSEIQHTVDCMRAKKPTMVILVGVGGSQLGAVAVYQAMYSTFACSTLQVDFVCLDTLETRVTRSALDRIEREFMRGGVVVACIVSKTGKTVETGINAALLWNLFERFYGVKAYEYVLAITDEGSVLHQRSSALHIPVCTIPHKVGGRFSVFSAAGLAPLALVGSDINQLCAGARDAFTDCTSVSLSNSAAMSAAMIYAQWVSGIAIHDTFIFVPECAGFGAWYRQLVGESLGKNQISHPNQAVGIMPTISVGTLDLHSVVQLYLGGPKERFTTFVTASQQAHPVELPVNGFAYDVGMHKEITTQELSAFFVQSVQMAYSQQGLPFATLDIQQVHEYTIGYTMMMKMIETVYVGYLLEVNVFDQPHVELYKKHMRHLLG